jgi:hypothetical protein
LGGRQGTVPLDISLLLLLAAFLVRLPLRRPGRGDLKSIGLGWRRLGVISYFVGLSALVSLPCLHDLHLPVQAGLMSLFAVTGVILLCCGMPIFSLRSRYGALGRVLFRGNLHIGEGEQELGGKAFTLAYRIQAVLTGLAVLLLTAVNRASPEAELRLLPVSLLVFLYVTHMALPAAIIAWTGRDPSA